MARPFFNHQRDAFHYARVTQHPALFLEMRLGKTLVAIRRIKLYPNLQRVLIVAPNSALGTWEDELRKEGEKSIVYLQGSRLERLNTLMESKARWNLINKEGFLALSEIGGLRWTAVVLDESTFVKNPQAKVTKFFLSNFRDVQHRWILTGMPNPQSDLELWSQLAFLDGKAFGFHNYWSFRRAKYEQRFGYDWKPRPGTRSMVKRTVGARACVIRRADVDMDTERIYQVRRFTLPKKLRETYDTAEKDFVLERDGAELKKTIFALPAYQWMRRLCGGECDGELIWRAKHKELVRLLSNELRREKVLVWFAYNSQLHAVEKELRKHVPTAGCLAVTGKVKPKVRRAYYRAWRTGKIRILLLQVRVAQMGLDFSAADTSIYFSSPASVSIRTQSEDRICHPQKKRAVLYIDLLCRDSVEEDLYYAVRKRRARSRRMLSRAVLYGMQERRS